MSQFIRHDTCPKCGRKEKLGVFDDNEHCFHPNCGYHKNYGDNTETPKKKVTAKVEKPLKFGLPEDPPTSKFRGLDISTLQKYKITVAPESSKLEAIFPRFDLDGNHVFNQLRSKDKQFRTEGSMQTGTLFGQNLFPPGGKSITVTEGYYDSPSAFQLTGSRYPNVGVMSASTAKKECVDNFEYLDSFEKIVLNFDNDEPGKKAAKEVAQLFSPGKVYILHLRERKDANEYLTDGLHKEYVNEWFRAPVFLPDGLLIGSDPALLDDIVNYKEPHSIPYPWTGLNKATYGLRLGELTLFTADTGVGKTTFMKEIEYQLLQDKELQDRGYGVGFLHLEEPKRETALGLMSIHKNKPYHLPDTEKTKEELVEAYNEVVNTDRVVIWDHFGSNDIDVVLSKIRHMAALGCRYIVVDHLTIIVSDQSGDERKQLDEISTKIKTLTLNLQICCICVIHINRQGMVRGSAGPEQVSNNVIRLERDKKETDDWRRNVTKLIVEKCRLSGRTGPAAWVFYNPMTGRLEELSKEQVDDFEQGGNGAGHEFDSYAG